MNRAAILPLLLVLAALAAPIGAGARPLGQTEVVSAGIGLGRADWEAVHGLGVEGQNYVTYEDGRYFVQFRGDVVSYLEFGWPDPGVTFAEAEAVVLELIPSDARLAESFYAPPTGSGPIGLSMQRYTSRALVDLVPDFGGEATGGILAIYGETPAPDRFEPNVARVSLTIGTAP
jgi:hypothetical protein